MITNNRIGMLLLVSGPSGSGKTTLCRRSADEGLSSYAISCTTRSPRSGERHGEDYFFLSVEQFKQKVDNGEFIEHAEVHGNFYGTLKSEVLNVVKQGIDVVIDIDVQGASLIRECQDPIIQQALVELFVMPPSEAKLLKRLSGRGTDSDEIIKHRMINSLEEMQHWDKYTYCIISEDKETDYSNFKSLILTERLSVSRFKDKT